MNTNQPPKEHKSKIIAWFPGTIWHRLTEPMASIEDVTLRRKSQLLSMFLLIMFFLFALLSVTYYMTIPGYTPPLPSLGGYALLIGSYVLNRIRYYNLAAVLTVSTVPIVLFLELLTNTSPNPIVTLNYLILGLLLSSILLSVRGTIILTGITILGMLLMPIVASAAIPDFRIIIGPLSTILIGSALAVVSMHHRNQVEEDRHAQLKKEIAERKRAEEKIEATVQEKEVLLKEVHHRVKNNLQVVSSLLYLQSKGIEDEAILEKFIESQNRIRSMALVHESLSKTKDLNRINFADYVQNLVIHVFRSFSGGAGGISPKIDVEDVFLSINTAVPCGLIINELVSNAVKYGFPDERKREDQKEIRVTFELQSSEYVLTVSDNGIGLPEDFDYQNTKSLGLKLVDSLVGQLDGTLELQQQNGTKFKVVFAKPN